MIIIVLFVENTNYSKIMKKHIKNFIIRKKYYIIKNNSNTKLRKNKVKDYGEEKKQNYKRSYNG